MKFIITFIVFAIVLIVIPKTNGKTYTKCELAVELNNLGFAIETLPDWVCLIKAESSMKTHILGTINKNKSRDYGLFQINNKYWCKMGSAGKDCNISCENLIDDDITDDVRCAKKIFKRQGFRAWYGWRDHCQNKTLPSVSECF